MGVVSASFRVRTTVIEPREVGALLLHNADYMSRATTKRRKTLSPSGMHEWVIDIRADDTLDLAWLLEDLLEEVGPLAPKMAAVRAADPGVDVLFHLEVTPYSYRMSAAFKPEIVAGIAALGGRFQVEFRDSAHVEDEEPNWM